MMFVALFFLFIQSCAVAEPARAITYYSEASQDHHDRFLRVVYSKNMPFFDSADFKQNKYYIVGPSVPIEYNRMKYYWNETFMDLEEVSNLCEYRISMLDGELDNTFYRNGTQVRSLLYTCSWGQSCRGLECTYNLPRFPYFLIIIFLLMWLLVYAKNRMRKEFEDAWRLREKLRRPLPQLQHNTVPPRNPDSPPSYNSVMRCPSPPPYETVVSGNVTYIVPSF
ncbi:unnamed protein product [Caenorhabditis sp. 36 PRJEB53466]|nr:unnamed protein product [Caenorhabditis sp. 36 PRJEB53466]